MQVHEVSKPELVPHVGPDAARPVQKLPSTYELAVRKTDAIAAIHQLGYTRAEARVFVEEALEQLPQTCTLQNLLAAALRVAREAMAGATRAQESGPTWGWGTKARSRTCAVPRARDLRFVAWHGGRAPHGAVIVRPEVVRAELPKHTG
ncbi:MAG TPA: RuvA C-terminal domain-containing protein [Kofleriaceae bacterium]